MTGVFYHSVIHSLDFFICFKTIDFTRMYADDTSITYTGKYLNEIDDYLNKDLKSVNTWLSSYIEYILHWTCLRPNA